MQDNQLEMKPINSLLNESFYIPAYQRGYRWTKRQVKDLLDDLQEFEKKAHDSEFYCLQPIVVKQYGDKWEVVDGQQRLTTIYIILTCLKEILPLLDKTRYEISYETRTDSTTFLENIDERRAEENIDFFHIVEAKKAVEEWFKDKGNYRIKLIQTLLNENDIGKNVKVIWYELGEHENATEVFTRLNMGKIPLVNAELVKALFLKSSNFKRNENQDDENKSIIVDLEQVKISQEWDSIEKSLQDDAFWYFLSKEDKKDNRIEFVLDLRAAQLDCTNNILESDKLRTFLQFSSWFENDDIDVSDEWLKIKRVFMVLEEWFNDRSLYHLIGYLIHQGHDIKDILKTRNNSHSKSDFRTRLLNKIIQSIFIDSQNPSQSFEKLESIIETLVSSLSYESNKQHNQIRGVLLLFNIVSLLNSPSSNARFEFERYKLDEWDIEHIRSVASDMPKNSKLQAQWLEQIIDYISDDDTLDQEKRLSDKQSIEAQLIKEQATSLNRSSFKYSQFEELYQRVTQFYNPSSDDEVDNSIGNLTLLDSGTNRSYKNAIFPIKRKCIIKLDKQATYVPLCTKNVFLKYYSKNVDEMLFWKDKDSSDYQQAMINTFTYFFCSKELNHG
ncbi:GmrSD restriction endonuclease domain-containing protein [Psychrobacter alimentarius]|uniref:GmrSD restriction endonuclease domain-containing protein n=1 Tax=Psychrobacter alimentarius TaxID=261164 RepID=UPI003FCFBAC3